MGGNVPSAEEVLTFVEQKFGSRSVLQPMMEVLVHV